MTLKLVKKTKGGPIPPRPLGVAGGSLWSRVHGAYQIQDEGGIELLALACECLDRAESLRARIDADGEIVVVNGAPKDHPGLRHELANRSFVSKAIQRLGLDVEAVKPVGRPGIGGFRG